MSISPRPGIEKLTTCYHGGPNYAELASLSIRPEDVIDFSVSSNPYPPPPSVRRAMCDAVIDRYPDSTSAEITGLLAGQLGVALERILVGSGSMEVIRLVALAYLDSSDKALVLKPTFGEYEVACRVAGATVIEQWAEEKNGFAFDIGKTVAIIKEQRPKVVFICNPNNPTGRYLSKREVERVLDACTGSLLVVDEAYIAFTGNAWSINGLLEAGNVISVRSMTKDYALAGLRLGYCLAREDVIAILRRVCPPWNVNAAAQAAGAAALRDTAYLRRSEERIKQAKNWLMTELGKLGFIVLPSATNFFLVRVKSAADFRSLLLRHGLMVRDCTSFGLPQYVRIAPRTMPECRRLVTTLEKLKVSGELSP